MKTTKCHCGRHTTSTDTKAQGTKLYPGTAIDVADNDKVNPQMVDNATRHLNDNRATDEMNAADANARR